MTKTNSGIDIKAEDITQKFLDWLEKWVDNGLTKINKTGSLIKDIKANTLRILKLNWSGHKRTPDWYNIWENKTILLTRNWIVQVIDEETWVVTVAWEYKRTRKYDWQSKTDHEMILFLDEK